MKLTNNKIKYKEQISKLFDKYYVRLCYYANDYLFNFELSREVVQSAFVKIWEKNYLLDDMRSEEAYLFKVVKNCCIDYIKGLDIREAHKIYSLQKEDEQFYEEKQIELNELTHLISDTIAGFPIQAQQMYTLSKDSDKKYKEIANILDVSVKTVEWNIARIRKELKKNIENYLYH
jgi:RNA polymerase sigma-70 factor (ECF subfamily)